MKVDFNQSYGYLRILHALPQVNSYDCYLDEKLYAKDLLFEDFTIYKPLPAGEHHLTLCKHKQTEDLITHPFWIAPNKIYTLLFTFEPYTQSIQYYLLNDPLKKIPADHLLCRVASFCQLQVPLELRVVDTHPLFKKLKNSQPSPYLSFMPASYTLELINTDTKKVVLKKENYLFKATRYYTLYLLGGTKGFPTRFVRSIDGNSFLSFPKIN